MSGNGGGAAYETLGGYQTDFHSLLLTGFTRDSNGNIDDSWSGYIVTGHVMAVHVAAGGTGYANYGFLQLNGQSGADACILYFTATAGVVDAVYIVSGGRNYTTGDLKATTDLAGAGSNCTVHVTAVGRDLPYDAGGTYATNPSILRFILEKGLTDVGGNPYEVANHSRVLALMSEVIQAYNKLKTEADANNVTADYAEDVGLAAASGVRVPLTDVTTINNDAVDFAIEKAASIVSSAVMEAQAKVSNLLNLTTAGAKGREDIISTAVLAKTLTQARDIFEDATSDIATDTNAIANFALSVAKLGARQILAEAFSNVEQLIDNGMVDDAVDNFEKRALPAFLRRVNSFAGGMVDTNSVLTSTFTVGMAILQDGFQTDINDFRAKLKLQLYSDLYSNFTTVSTQLFQQYLSLYVQEYMTRMEIYKVVYSGKMDMFSRESDGERSMITNLTSTNVQTAAVNANGYIDSTLRARIEELGHKMAILQSGVSDLRTRRANEIAEDTQLVSLLTEINRIRYVAEAEEYERNLEYLIKRKTWDLDLFQSSGNILSAVTGSVVPRAAHPTPFQTGVGGALAGASIGLQMADGAKEGSKIGAIGGPGMAGIGAGIGALIGALGG